MELFSWLLLGSSASPVLIYTNGHHGVTPTWKIRTTEENVEIGYIEKCILFLRWFTTRVNISVMLLVSIDDEIYMLWCTANLHPVSSGSHQIWTMLVTPPDGDIMMAMSIFHERGRTTVVGSATRSTRHGRSYMYHLSIGACRSILVMFWFQKSV